MNKVILKGKWAVLAIFLLVFNNSFASDDDKKFNPGHYIAINESEEIENTPFLTDSSVIGINKRYHWKDLEPEKGKYDFSSIKADLSYAKSFNKQLIAFIIDKSFIGVSTLPDYLSDYTVTVDEKIVSKRWDPFVVERFILLGSEIAAEFDDDENFEGMAIQESALPGTVEILAEFEYTPEKYRDALIDILKGLGTSMRNSQVFWYMNFLKGENMYLEEVCDSILDYNITISGPDLLPFRKGLLWLTYPLYKEHHEDLHLACSVQKDSYKHHKWDTIAQNREIENPHPDGYISMENIFLYGRDELFLDYVFWQNITEPPNEGAFSIYDAIQVIRKYNDFNKQSKPTVPTNISIKQLAEPLHDFIIYPNPNYGEVHIDLSGNDLTFTEIIIYNSTGTLIFREPISSSNITFNLDEYPKGIYFIVLKKSGEYICTKGIIRL